MPLVPSRDLLKRARAAGYCVGGFDVFNLELLEGVLAACESASSPVMVQLSAFSFEFYDLGHLLAMIIPRLEATTVPVALHLDHGPKGIPFELLVDCIPLGFSSVIADFSQLPFEQNIAMVQKVVGVAERYGVSVEGELGEVGRNPGASGSEIMAMMTDPRQVAEFVDRTGVHSLAVSVGSISGCFDTRIIELDFERLAAISRATAIPLVFHGGTGIPEEQLRRAVPMGVAKVNIAHGLRKAFEDALKLGFCGHADYVDPRPVLKAAMQDVERYAARRLDVFGCTARG